MKRVNRLNNSSIIAGVLRSKCKVHQPTFQISLKENHLKTYQIAIVVSKKVSKKAVVRNKIKRQVRSMIDNLKIDPKWSVNLVILIRATWLEQSFSTNQQYLTKSIQKLMSKGGRT